MFAYNVHLHAGSLFENIVWLIIFAKSSALTEWCLTLDAIFYMYVALINIIVVMRCGIMLDFFLCPADFLCPAQHRTH